MDAKPTLRDRIGGRWALSWQASVAGSALIVALYAARGSTFGYEGPRAMWLWLAVALIAVAVKSAVQVAANGTVLRDRHVRTLHPALVVAFHFSVGVIFAATTLIAEALLIPMDGPRPASSWVFRIVTIALCGLWWYLIASVVLDARDRFGRARDELLRDLVSLQVMEIEERDVAEQLRTRVRTEMDGQLTQTRLRVAESLASASSDISGLSEDLRNLATGPVRTLSHELMTAGEQSYPRSSILRVLPSVWHVQRFWIFPVVIFVSLAFIPDGRQHFGAIGGFAAGIALGLVVGTIMWVANRAIERHPEHSRVTYAGALILMVTVALLFVSDYRFPEVVTGEGITGLARPSSMVGAALLIVVPVLATSFAAALRDHRAEVLSRLRADHDDALSGQWALAERLALTSRQLGSELHGSLQTRLMVSAGALDRAADTGDTEGLIEALTHTMNVLREPFEPSVAPASIESVIAQHAGLWDGLMEIDTAVASGASVDSEATLAAIGAVVEEALSNAYRHGQATRASVVVEPGPTVTVRDNGVGSAGGTDSTGMGLRRLRSLGTLEFTPEPGSTRLTVHLGKQAVPQP